MSGDNIRLVSVGIFDRNGKFEQAYGFDGWMDKNEWEKIAHLMERAIINNPDDRITGNNNTSKIWVTFHPIEVEKNLGLSGDHTITARREASERQRELRKSRYYFDKGVGKSW